VIRREREGSTDEEEEKPLARPAKDLLKSDLLHPSSPAQSKRKFASSPTTIPSPPAKKPHTSPPVPRTKPKPPAPVKEAHDSDEDAKFAAELDMALNSTGRRTRGAVAGTRTKPRPKKKAVKNGEPVEKKKRAPNPNNAFHQPMLLSPQLSDVIFETELSRPVRDSVECSRLILDGGEETVGLYQVERPAESG
jgi:chromatin remodeling complex protein RSC6